MSKLLFPYRLIFKFESGGLFMSPGFGKHPRRRLTSYELIVVRSGTLHLKEGTQLFSVESGETLILLPGRFHQGTADFTSELSFYWFHFRLFEPAQISTASINVSQHTRPRRHERIMELSRQLLNDHESGDLTEEQAGLFMTLMLLEIQDDRLAPPSSDTNLAARASEFIAHHALLGLHAGEVATALSCNPDYLGRLFHKVYGHTVTSAIHRRQIAAGRALLRDSNRNIDEIARGCGLKDSRYFRKLFTRHQGISPKEYRALHSRKHINIT